MRQSSKPDLSTLDVQASKPLIVENSGPLSKKDSQPSISNNHIRFNTNFVSNSNKFRFGTVQPGAVHVSISQAGSRANADSSRYSKGTLMSTNAK